MSSGNAKNRVLRMAVIGAAASLTLLLPRPAVAQSDAIRIMAGRVLGQVSRDRRGDDWDYGALSRRDRERLEKERRERAKHCARNRDHRRCDAFEDLAQRRGAWCLDRDRNGRCDLQRRDDRDGRGPWSGRDDDDRYGRRRGR